MYTNDGKKNSASSPGWILLPEQIDALTKKPYAYNASAGSFLEVLFLQKFWMWLVKFVPENITPCTLTCLGLGLNLTSCFALLYFSPEARVEAPSWTHVLCAIVVFLYQTLDALDGKQAIKVQDTQLEELYDHGCDAISTVFLCLTTAVACQWGSLPLLMFIVFITSMLAFYTTHWQDHVTHIMIFGKFDVSEVQVLILSLHLITASYGQLFWRSEIFGIELRVWFGLCTILSMCGTVVVNVAYVLGHETPLDSYVKIPRKTNVKIWYPVIPVLVLSIFTTHAYSSGLFHPSPCIFAIAYGLAYAKLTIKLVIANVTHADMDLWDSSLVVPFLLCLNTYLPSSYMIPCYTSLLCGLVYTLMDVARYFTYASWDMKDALDVWVFGVKYPPSHPKSRSKANAGVYINGLNNKEVLATASKSCRI